MKIAPVVLLVSLLAIAAATPILSFPFLKTAQTMRQFVTARPPFRPFPRFTICRIIRNKHPKTMASTNLDQAAKAAIGAPDYDSDPELLDAVGPRPKRQALPITDDFWDIMPFPFDIISLLVRMSNQNHLIQLVQEQSEKEGTTLELVPEN